MKKTNKEHSAVFESFDALRHSTILAELRARIADVEGAGARHAELPLGVAAIAAGMTVTKARSFAPNLPLWMLMATPTSLACAA